MIIGTDDAGKVLMVGVGGDIAAMPVVFNGAKVTAQVLTDEQEAAYNALPSDRGGAVFDGTAFSSVAADPPPPAPAITKAALQAQIAALKAKVDALP